MTATDSPDAWTAQLEQLRARYKHVRPAILAALNILQAEPDASVDDAKARAAQHGVRITAASVNAAQRLLSRQDAVPATIAPAAQAELPAPKPKRERRPRAADTSVDAEALIRQVVGKLQNRGNAETQRLRTAIRKAIELLQSAVG